MSNISKMFPVIFYLVAVLISLTSMTRMIEEERIEIGTLKAMGYTNMQIISKYIIYSLFACIIGGVLGMTVGLYLLPNIVWMLYSMIYNLPEFYCTYRVEIGLLGIIIAFICIGGATIIVATNELKQMPAVLMRPKPPKKGKRILLERIKFIWKRFNFSQKVTARNIFRYKKRAIMTIIGIAGCTALMLTGFGIRDSVNDIPSVQFRKIFSYDLSISLTNTKGLGKLNEYFSNNENIKNYTEICATTAKLGEKNYNVTVFVPKNTKDLDNAFNLTNPETGEKVSLDDDGIIISDKIAYMIGANIGDEVNFIDGDDISYKFKVKDIMKNYVGHYVFMSKTFYENNIKQYKTNMIFANTNENLSEDVQNNISQEILNIEGVASVSVISSLMKSVSDMLNTMNYVVIILIVASALLAFVVLYNLANINIAERQREIATLKVLGFYDKEVDNYINKENIIFTIVAIAIGLVFGTFLTSGIISSIEIDSLRFMRHILPISYVYSAVITFVFSIIVNFIIHFVLKKIDMIESLKSVE
jgi:putative ABC transport system permease protein